MLKRTVVFAAFVGLIYSGSTATPVVAAKIGTGTGGVFTTSFSCDVFTNKCTCKGSALGADCKAMAKNCKGAIKQKDGSYRNIVLECKTSSCNFRVCDMSRKVPPRPKFPLNITPGSPGKVTAPTKTKPKVPTTKGTIMKMIPMQQYKMKTAPMKRKSN